MLTAIHTFYTNSEFALENLNLDTENIVLKIYGHFLTSAKRRKTLKVFHIFAKDGICQNS